jgi:hypothetical protein
MSVPGHKAPGWIPRPGGSVASHSDMCRPRCESRRLSVTLSGILGDLGSGSARLTRLNLAGFVLDRSGRWWKDMGPAGA